MSLVAERCDVLLERPFADQHQLGSEPVRQLAERFDHHVGLLLAVQPADIDQQRPVVGQAELVPELGVAAGWTELAELDAERDDADVIDAVGPKLGAAAILAEREHFVEAAVERTAIGIADPLAQARQRPADELREGPLNIDRRKVGHICRDQRRIRMALAVADRRPRQIIGVLALDQVGPEMLERLANRPVAQHQPVIRAARHVGRSDRHGDRAILLDDLVSGARDDHQMAVRGRLQDMPPLVQQIGAHSAADLGPALGQVAEQLGADQAADRGRRGSS